jgi:Skp family chaperone for outer membrane proteins
LEEKTNPKKAQKRNKEFEKRVAELEQRMQKKRALLEKQSDYLTEKLQDTVFQIIEKISITDRISIVLNKTISEKSSVFYVEKRMDLTDKIITELDARLKDIKLPDIKE